MSKKLTLNPKHMGGGVPKSLGSPSMPKRMSAPVTCGEIGSAPGTPPVRRVPRGRRTRVRGLAG